MQELILAAELKGNNPSFRSTRCVYSPEGVCPTVTTCQGGRRQPKVLLKGNGE